MCEIIWPIKMETTAGWRLQFDKYHDLKEVLPVLLKRINYIRINKILK